ncbi:hypothetical protein L1987_77508 [Smallanthus sonchifolius]|uniref:Uncharacterized protein n=1 Tax=Smallanthus sonchifolius TaxID=185202 RepID=A0ACB8ZB31_9ASTR|nr:hypothetical protein L1987_77508 [Smallanthus sonchifolius]
MESLYPNSTEHIVASALLMLSSSPSFLLFLDVCSNVDRCEGLLLNKSFSRSSASSTVSSDEISSDEARERRLHIVASAIAHSEREMKLKVVRKSRSKTLWISDSRRISTAEQKLGAASCISSLTTEVSSCLSGGSSSLVSSSASCKSKMKREKSLTQDAKKKPSSAVSSAHLLRRSEAILKMLAHNGCASEVRIRQLLGDSPDTSKALRMLLKKAEVRRSGAGGRTDPFIYQISAK